MITYQTVNVTFRHLSLCSSQYYGWIPYRVICTSIVNSIDILYRPYSVCIWRCVNRFRPVFSSALLSIGDP